MYLGREDCGEQCVYTYMQHDGKISSVYVTDGKSCNLYATLMKRYVCRVHMSLMEKYAVCTCH